MSVRSEILNPRRFRTLPEKASAWGYRCQLSAVKLKCFILLIVANSVIESQRRGRSESEACQRKLNRPGKLDLPLGYEKGVNILIAVVKESITCT